MDWDFRIGRRLKLRDLHILLAVVQAGSMAKAAKQLAVSQPAIWQAIVDMERVLGVRLLDRSPRGIETTRYGKALIRRSNAVFDELRQGVKEIEFLADPTSGELRIGTSEPIAGVLVSLVIDRLSRQYPRVVFHVAPGDTALLYHELHERNVELIVSRVRRPAADEHTIIPIHDDTFVVAAGAKSRWTGRRKLKLADLIHEPWILPPLDSWSGLLVREAFQKNGLELPKATVFTFSNSLRNNLAAAGQFLTVLPDYLIRSSAKHSSLTALPIELALTRRQVGIVTLKNRTLSPVAELFIACARDVAKSISSNPIVHTARWRKPIAR